MKTVIEHEDIELIAQRVAEILTPLLSVNDGGDEPFFDVSTLSEYLCVEDSWIYQQVHLRKIPYYKFGKYVRFRKSEIEEWSKSLKLSR